MPLTRREALGVRFCRVCQGAIPYGRSESGRCGKCAQWWWRHGTERPTDLADRRYPARWGVRT